MISRRNLAFSLALLVGLGFVVSAPQLAGARVAAAFAELRGADPGWLWLCGVTLLVSVLCAAGAWRSAIAACRGPVAFSDAAARYGVGSLVNTFAPARLGDAVRIGLFSKVLDGPERLWTTGGVWAVVAGARGLAVAAFVVAASVSGAVPVWPAIAVAGGVLGLVVFAWASRKPSTRRRVAHLLDAVRALERSPRAAGRVCGWALVQTAARAVGAAAAAAALGAHDPVAAALVIVPALELSGLLPLTPGNIGVTSGAIAVALKAQGVGLTTGLSIGIAFHAAETVVGLAFGIAGALFLVGYPSPLARRYVLRAAGAAACLAAAAFGLVSFV